MYVLEVIPLARTAPPVPLSYRSATKFPPGALVKVPLRKQTVLGLVVSSEPAQDAKAALKQATFTLAKSAPKRFGQLPTVFIHAAEAVANYHATSLGSVLGALLVPVLSSDVPARISKGKGFVIEHAEAPLQSRETSYESTFADGIVMLVVPTLAEVRTFAERYRKYKPLVLSSAVSPKKREAVLEELLTNDEKKGLIIVTPGYAWVPVPRLSRIIIERMSAGSYTLPKRPYLDMHIAITELARAREVPVTYGDYPLPLEYRLHAEKPLAIGLETDISIVDAREAQGEERWSAVPKPIKKEIGAALAEGGTVGVLAVRRGYAPSVVCRDCGTTVTDDYGRALSLVTGNGTRMLRSADGRTLVDIRGSKVLCKNCGSWNLQPLGVGVERVVEELRDAFPGTEILQIDADTLTAKVRRELIKPSEHGRLIVGTELLLPWLSTESPLALGVIASADSLLALPFWRARERFVRIGLMLAERSRKLRVVTRHTDDAALSAIAAPTESTFWKEEISLRKLLKYPPFGTLLVFHIEGSEERVAEVERFIRAALAPREPITLPVKQITESSFRGTMVLQLPAGKWPDSKLVERLSALPPFVRLHIDSESFF